MSLFNALFKQDPLQNKVLAINENIEEVIPDHSSAKFNVIWYGDFETDPKKLVYCVRVQTDQEKYELMEDAQLIKKLRLILEKYDYPQDAQSFVKISFESQETVDRESGGSWDLHLK